MNSADPNFSWRLSTNLENISAARGRNAVLANTARAARDLAGADGFFVVPHRLSDPLLVTSGNGQVEAIDNQSSLYRLLSSPEPAVAPIVRQPCDTVAQLPSGAQLRANSMVTVSFGSQSDYRAMGFLWRPESARDLDGLSLLQAIAWGSSLALRAQRIEEELRRGQQRQRFQIIELQRRARNILAIVRSIIRRSSHSAESMEDFTLHLEARISAVARIQGALTTYGRAGPELEDLIRIEMAANAVRDHRFDIQGPSLHLSTRAAEALALALHELTTNALKFGALAAAQGRISVRWTIEGSQQPARAIFEWRESGVAIASTAPRRRGFGQELLERVLPYELDAITRFTLAAGGAHCEIELPLNERNVGSLDMTQRDDDNAHDIEADNGT